MNKVFFTALILGVAISCITPTSAFADDKNDFTIKWTNNEPLNCKPLLEMIDNRIRLKDEHWFEGAHCLAERDKRAGKGIYTGLAE